MEEGATNIDTRAPADPLSAKAPTPATIAFSVRKVAELLSISVRTVWRLVAQGEIPAPRRFGRTVRWDREELLGWWKSKGQSRGTVR